MKKICLIFSLMFMTTSAFADLSDKLGDLIGYTIIGKKRISGWYEEDTKEHGEQFNGCNYGRVIVFADNKILTCTSYGYYYAFNPEAIILSNGSLIKMIVGDEIYDMRI